MSSKGSAQDGVSGKKRHVWMVNHHASFPTKDGSEGRHLRLAQELSAHGWTASVIGASTTHSSGRQILKGWKRLNLVDEGGVPTLWVKASPYTSGMAARFVGMGVFALNLVLPGATKALEKPDVVLGSTVHPLAAWAASRLARRNRVPFVFEIRDVWPETLVDLGAIKAGGVMARSMDRLMRSLVDAADLVVAPLPRVDRYLEEGGQGDVPFLWVSNGTVVDAEKVRSEKEAGEPFRFIYTGAHGNANILDFIMDAFNLACQTRPDLDLELVFVGDGPQKEQYQQHAETLEHSDRIKFHDRVERDLLDQYLDEADACVAALPDLDVFKYGISPNKLSMYMASGMPTLWSGSTPNSPIAEADAGLFVEAGDVEGFGAAMVQMAETSQQERDSMAARGRQHVIENYTFGPLAKKLADGLNKLVSGEDRP